MMHDAFRCLGGSSVALMEHQDVNIVSEYNYQYNFSSNDKSYKNAEIGNILLLPGVLRARPKGMMRSKVIDCPEGFHCISQDKYQVSRKASALCKGVMNQRHW